MSSPTDRSAEGDADELVALRRRVLELEQELAAVPELEDELARARARADRLGAELTRLGEDHEARLRHVVDLEAALELASTPEDGEAPAEPEELRGGRRAGPFRSRLGRSRTGR